MSNFICLTSLQWLYCVCTSLNDTESFSFVFIQLFVARKLDASSFESVCPYNISTGFSWRSLRLITTAWSCLRFITLRWVMKQNVCLNSVLLCHSDNTTGKTYIMMEARLGALFKSESEYTILDKWVECLSLKIICLCVYEPNTTKVKMTHKQLDFTPLCLLEF